MSFVFRRFAISLVIIYDEQLCANVYVADRLKNVKHLPTVTLAFVIVFVTTYAAQLLLVGSLSQDAGFQAATIVKNVVGSGSVVFSWLFHSSHTHLLQNLAVFVLTGWWVENRVDRDRFILGIAAILGIGANVAAVVLFQTPGAGISGITTGLVTMVALGNFEGLLNAGSHLLRNIVVFTLSTAFCSGLSVLSHSSLPGLPSKFIY